MISKKHGIPKKRLPKNLGGLCRSGKVENTYGETFWVNIANFGPWKFDKSDSKTFNKPIQGKKVYVSFLGTEEKQYFPYKITDRQSQKTYYEKK